MASPKQIEANRLNAQKSTGPRIPEGKAKSSLNALLNGFSATFCVLPGEPRKGFYQLFDELEAEYLPETPSERFCITQMAIAQWKIARSEQVECDVLYGKGELSEKDARADDRLLRQQGMLQRAYYRALKEFRQIRKERSAAPPEPAPDPEPAERTQSDNGSPAASEISKTNPIVSDHSLGRGLQPAHIEDHQLPDIPLAGFAAPVGSSGFRRS